MKRRYTVGVGLAMAMAVMLIGCASPTKEYARAVQTAHGEKAWQDQRALVSDIEVTFGGKTVFDGRLLMTTDGEKVRLTSWNGPVLTWDGKQGWLSPADAEIPKADFQLSTWPFFVRLPFAMADYSKQMELVGEMPIWDRPYEVSRLMTDQGNGSEWYMIYRQPGSALVRSIAYTRTFDATPDPHAVIFNRFVLMNDVKLSTEWSIFRWNQDTGISGTPMGQVILSNLSWTRPPRDAFIVPDGARLLGDTSDTIAAAK